MSQRKSLPFLRKTGNTHKTQTSNNQPSSPPQSPIRSHSPSPSPPPPALLTKQFSAQTLRAKSKSELVSLCMQLQGCGSTASTPQTPTNNAHSTICEEDAQHLNAELEAAKSLAHKLAHEKETLLMELDTVKHSENQLQKKLVSALSAASTCDSQRADKESETSRLKASLQAAEEREKRLQEQIVVANHKGKDLQVQLETAEANLLRAFEKLGATQEKQGISRQSTNNTSAPGSNNEQHLTAERANLLGEISRLSSRVSALQQENHALVEKCGEMAQQLREANEFATQCDHRATRAEQGKQIVACELAALRDVVVGARSNSNNDNDRDNNTSNNESNDRNNNKMLSSNSNEPQSPAQQLTADFHCLDLQANDPDVVGLYRLGTYNGVSFFSDDDEPLGATMATNHAHHHNHHHHHHNIPTVHENLLQPLPSSSPPPPPENIVPSATPSHPTPPPTPPLSPAPPSTLTMSPCPPPSEPPPPHSPISIGNAQLVVTAQPTARSPLKATKPLARVGTKRPATPVTTTATTAVTIPTLNVERPTIPRLEIPSSHQLLVQQQPPPKNPPPNSRIFNGAPPPSPLSGVSVGSSHSISAATTAAALVAVAARVVSTKTSPRNKVSPVITPNGRTQVTSNSRTVVVDGAPDHTAQARKELAEIVSVINSNAQGMDAQTRETLQRAIDKLTQHTLKTCENPHILEAAPQPTTQQKQRQHQQLPQQQPTPQHQQIQQQQLNQQQNSSRSSSSTSSSCSNDETLQAHKQQQQQQQHRHKRTKRVQRMSRGRVLAETAATVAMLGGMWLFSSRPNENGPQNTHTGVV